ncbi:MAG: hypothetical protein KDB04_03810 [Acidimicrobiales bacterium]|nr:hypothetical protein [Acidimicrobiales bacterium]HRW39354.1 hypothetical protein [Aquihabitans sp.]
MSAATDPVPPADDDDTAPLRARGWAVPVLLAVAALVVLVGAGVVIAKVTAPDSSGETLTFVVPEGTTEKLFFGETVDIMPSRVELDVGDTLVVRNDDTETMVVGPFTVRPGETLTQHFQRAQTLVGECSLSGSGTVEIVVT